MRLSVQHLSRPREGELHNGDAVVVRREGPRVLLAVVDALGHGPDAAEVAARACAQLERSALEAGVVRLFEDLGVALQGSRGAAATLCLWNEGRCEAAGVGNVELRALRTRLPVRLTPGILGQRNLEVRSFGFQLPAGDRLVLFSDGLSPLLALEETRALTGRDACRQLLDRFGRPNDDATILIADVETWT